MATSMIRALFVPPNRNPWMSQTFVPGEGPDPFSIFRELEKEGIVSETFDPLPAPWNPFAGKDSLLQSFDPVRSLRIALDQSRIDIIITIFEGAAAILGMLKTIGLLRRPLCILDVGLTETWKLRRRVLDFTLPRSDAIMVLGSNQVDYIRRTWDVKGQVMTIGHHLDVEFFRPAKIEQGSYVLTVGEDVGRDFGTLIAATRPLERELVIKARRHPPDVAPHEKNIRVIKERISFPELRQLYADSSVVVVPTYATLNACGVSTILEASAMAKPLVISDNPGVRDFFVPDETCLMVPREDPVAMQEAIQRLLDDPALGERLGKNARLFVERNCSDAVHAKRVAQAIKSVLSQGKNA